VWKYIMAQILQHFRKKINMPKDTNITNSQDQNSVVNEQAEAMHHNIPGDSINTPGKQPNEEEKITKEQETLLRSLSSVAGEEYTEGLTKKEAATRIEELQQLTGKGLINAGVPNQANTGEAE
jgi:hypothetical protein